MVAKGSSPIKPPFFDGTRYDFWKNKMRIYLMSISINLWNTCVIDYMAITGTDPLTREVTPKLMSNYTTAEIIDLDYDGKETNILYNYFFPTEYKRIITCKTTKAIWSMLEITQEGTTKVKESKIKMLEI